MIWLLLSLILLLVAAPAPAAVIELQPWDVCNRANWENAYNACVLDATGGPDASSALKVGPYPTNARAAASQRLKIYNLAGGPYTELFFGKWFKYSSNWTFDDGMKFAYFWLKTVSTGQSGSPWVGTCFTSRRFCFSAGTLFFNNGCAGCQDPIIQPNTWYWVQWRVKINTVTAGSINSDGALELWVNGVQVMSHTTLPAGKLTNTTDFRRIDRLEVYYAQDFKSTTGQFVLHDRVVVGTTKADTDMPGAPPGGDTTPPTAAITSPAAGAAISGNSVALTATATDDQAGGLATDVQFRHSCTSNTPAGVGCTNIGPLDTTSESWTATLVTGGLPEGPLRLSCRARDAALNSAACPEVSPTINNIHDGATGLTPRITAPAAGAIVTGATSSVTGAVGATQGVASVQLQVDGVDHGAPDTSAPFGPFTWTHGSDGTKCLRLVVTESTSGVTEASPSVCATVQNGAAPPIPANAIFPVLDTHLALDDSANVNHPELRVHVWPVNKPANVPVLKFDLSHISTNATGIVAKLNVKLKSQSGDASLNVAARRVTKANNLLEASGQEAATGVPWTPAPGCCNDDIPMAQADIATADDTEAIGTTLGRYEFDISPSAAVWIANPLANNGIALVPGTGAENTSRYFDSMNTVTVNDRPYLVVNFTLPSDPPPTPTPTQYQKRLRWTPAPFSQYTRVEVKVGGGNFAFLVNVPQGVGSYLHTGLAAGIMYTWRVAPCSNLPSGPACASFSNEVSFTTPTAEIVPVAPTAGELTATDTAITVTLRDLSSNEDGFRWYRSDDGGPYALGTNGDVGANVQSYTDTSVVAGVTYCYEAESYNEAGASVKRTARLCGRLVTTPTAVTDLVVE